MEEKKIIKSQKVELKKFQVIFGVVAAILFIIPFVDYIDHTRKTGYREPMLTISNLPELCWTPAFIIVVIVVFITWMYAQVSLTVTDKRIYGIAAFGKRVDLPLDTVTAVATGAFKTIAVTAASGSIKFGMIKNYLEIHTVISKLLIERQTQVESVAPTTIKQEIQQSNADELKKYKELLDSGVISQEEFDAKKKQLLGL